MGLTKQQLQDISRELGMRELLHGPADISRACLIARDGILPGSDVEAAGLGRAWGQYQQSRDGYVYLGDAKYIDWCVDTAQPMFAVALDVIDPARLTCDEDHVSIYLTSTHWDREHQHVAELLPHSFRVARKPMGWRDGKPGWRRDGLIGQPLTYHRHRQTGMTQGQWADLPKNAAALARPDFIRASMVIGSVAHEGPIEPSKLSLNMSWWQNVIVANNEARWLGYFELLSISAAVCLIVPGKDTQRQLIEQLIASAGMMEQSVAVSRLRSLPEDAEALTRAIQDVERSVREGSDETQEIAA